MKGPLKTEQLRVIKAFTYVKDKLKLDMVLVIIPMSANQLKKNPGTHFTIERSYRSTHDKNTFVVHFNQTITVGMTLLQIKKHSFHELLHALTWPYIDEYFAVMKHISDITLYNELAARSEETRENVTYNLERKLGPFVLPQCDWTTEE